MTIESNFDTGAEGWTMTGDPSTVTWETTGGHPSGYMHWVDGASGQDSYWVAPADFLGDQSPAFGGALSYDIEDTGNDYSGAPDVILTGGALTIVAVVGQAGPDWTHYSVNLDQTGGWTINGLGGAVATNAQIQQVLGNLQTLEIRAEFVNGGESGGLDNVILTGTATSSHSDFNADNHSDILLDNSSTGQLTIWEMNGGHIIGSGKAGSPLPAGWKAVGTGDFNQDGYADILLQNTATGQASIWLMNGTTKLPGGGQVGNAPGANFKLVGSGDFNGDGNADLLWENNTTGQASIWLMSGTGLMSAGKAGTALGSDWTAVGAGDFNGDGKSDILWQNTSTGQAAVWLMNGTTKLAGSGPVGSAPGANVKVIGTGDFNGDGKADILWENTTTGQASIWLMDGTSRLAGSGSAGSAQGTAWNAIGAADYNGDGKSDILWQNSGTGQVMVWLMDGTSVLSRSTVGSPGTAWHAVAG